MSSRTPQRPADPAISPFYKIFFLYIEPISTIVGAYFAHFLPSTYLLLTHSDSAPSPGSKLPISTTVTLSQLANLYLLFALNEGLVLRATNDLRVWKTLLFGLLVADIGHLYSVIELGHETYWQFWAWNAMGWGNVGFVYLGAMTRIAFLLVVVLQFPQQEQIISSNLHDEKSRPRARRTGSIFVNI